MGAGKKRTRRINWLKIKQEYMSSTKPLSAILAKYKVSRGRNTQNHTAGWIEEKKQLQNQVISKIKNKVVKKQIKEWERQQKLWKDIEIQAAKILKKYSNQNMTISPKDLASLASAIQTALKSQRLIKGESTENIDQRNIHLAIVDIIETAEKEAEK